MDNQIGSPPATSLGQSENINPDRLLELERFAEIGRLSASLLHEISNPLTAALLWLEQCGNHQSPHIRHVHSSIRVLQRYVDAARQQVRRESRGRTFRLQPELDQVKHILAPLAQSQGVQLRFDPANRYKLHGDPVKFQQIIANLVRNAIDSYSSCRTTKDVKLVNVQLDSCQGYVIITVSDRGCGIPNDQLAQLFQPFYSTKEDTKLGLGIGLFTVKRYIETDFQGSITVKSSAQHGTQFSVTLRMEPPVC